MVRKFQCFCAFMLGLCYLSSCTPPPPQASPRSFHSQKSVSPLCFSVKELPRILKISRRVWVALGYELSNTFLIATDQGNIIVDPGMDQTAVLAKKNDLLRVHPGPIQAIFYTHSHIDHVGGAGFWSEPQTEIWAHKDFREEFLKQYATFRTLEAQRGARQFGLILPPEDTPCSAIGPVPKPPVKVFPLLPTHTFSQSITLEIGGVRIELIHAPGETRDQTYIFLPEEGVLFIGDNFYASFPNLYTIRGTTPRPVNLWIRSLDLARNLEPRYLLPSHTAPVEGKEKVQEVLRNYRDAIQYVHDSAIRLALKEAPLPRIAESIQLPSTLRELPYLSEGYGTIPWSVKGIYESYLGWFDGRPETLVEPDFVPTLIREIELMGGADLLMEEILKMEERGELPLALHFTAKLYHSGITTAKLSREKITQKYLELLRKTGERSPNTNLRSYLLSYVQEKEGGNRNPPVLLSSSVPSSIPIDLFLENLRYLLKEEGGENPETLGIRFPDLGSTYYLTTRNGILEIQKDQLLPGNPPPFAILIVHSSVFRKLAMKQGSTLTNLLQGKIRIEGSTPRVVRFLNRFEEITPPALFDPSEF
jgi:alkyl sulfatase BDS1-like metallo-beta-lactamase superfamily hydrolase